MTLDNFSSQVVERHNKPEVEVGTTPEVLLTPLTISRNENERVLIEVSVDVGGKMVVLTLAYLLYLILFFALAVGQLHPPLHPYQAIRRNRARPLPQVHPFHDAKGRELCHPQEETGRRLRYLVPHHKLPLRNDAETQARRLYHPIHGGGRQGNLRNEAQLECKG